MEDVGSKRALRREMAQRALSRTPDAAEQAGHLAANHLIEVPEWRAPGALALFASLPDEIATRPIFAAARQIGRTCLFPRCLPGDRLEWCAIEDLQDLRAGNFGLREPRAELAPRAPQPGDWVAVPGLAFDRAGNRLGRGRGYFDRFLASPAAEGVLAFGLAFASQIVSSVPIDAHDRAVDALLSEQGYLRCRG